MATALDLEHDLEALYASAETLDEAAQRRLAPSLVAYAMDRSKQDGLFWLRWVRTRDEADPERSVKPFPIHLEYIRQLWTVYHEEPRVVVAKSRQMLVSWVTAAFCAWIARFTPNQAIYWQSQQYDDAAAMISLAEGGYQGRIQFIEAMLPSWMQQAVKCSEGRVQYPNGSMIQALAGGADKVRGKVASVYVGDEFARMEDQAGTYAAVAPLMQKGSRAIFISTPNGANTFCTLWHGRDMSFNRV